VAIDTSPTPASATIAVEVRRHARRGLLLIAFAVWNLWLWGTRTYNLFTDDEARSAAFIAVHLALYLLSTAFAVAFGVLGWRMRRETRT
jgi:hypothetical protein